MGNLVIGEVDHWWWLSFRAKVWRPSLVRAGLLGKIVEVGPRKVMAHWHDGEGREWHCCIGGSPGRAGWVDASLPCSSARVEVQLRLFPLPA